MPTEPAQIFLFAIEIALLLTGVGLLIWFSRPSTKTKWLTPNRMTLWPIAAFEFTVFLTCVFGVSFFGQLAMQSFFSTTLGTAVDRKGLEVFVYGLGFSGGSIVGWFIFPAIRRHLHANYGAEPAVAPPPKSSLSLLAAIRAGAITLAAAMPVVTLCSLAWAAVIRQLGLPEDPQPLIAIFEQTQSPWVLVGMLTVACVLAPISEELLFRAGIFRFLRQNSSRAMAMVLSGVLFGVVHGNWAGLLPLAALGAMLAVAYEVTGDIRVPIVAHALFNFNAVIVVLSGLSQNAP